MPTPELLTTAQAAALIGVSPATIVSYSDAGYIVCIRLPSGHRRYRRADLERLLEPEQRPA